MVGSPGRRELRSGRRAAGAGLVAGGPERLAVDAEVLEDALEGGACQAAGVGRARHVPARPLERREQEAALEPRDRALLPLVVGERLLGLEEVGAQAEVV